MLTPIELLPDLSKVWIFPFDIPLSGQQNSTLKARVNDFIESWQAHKEPVPGGSTISHDQFLIVAADTRQTEVSGCSIDSLQRAIQLISGEISNPIVDSGEIWVDDDGKPMHMSRAKFKELLSSGQFTSDRLVYDLSLLSLGEVRRSGLSKCFGVSWHAKAFNRQ